MEDLNVMEATIVGAAAATLVGLLLIPVLVLSAIAGIAWLIYRTVRALASYVADRRRVSWVEETDYLGARRADAICDIADLHLRTLARMDRLAEETIEGRGREVRR